MDEKAAVMPSTQEQAYQGFHSDLDSLVGEKQHDSVDDIIQGLALGSPSSLAQYANIARAARTRRLMAKPWGCIK